MTVKESAKQLLDFLSRDDIEWINLGDNPDCITKDGGFPHCVLTAMNHLANWTTTTSEQKNELRRAIIEEIGEPVPDQTLAYGRVIENWNDTPGRTFDDVRQVLLSIMEV
jgi:hypothetical protein